MGCLLLFPCVVKADSVDQTDAQKQVTSQNNNGSHGTMNEATDSVVIALMELSALNIPGAISNGYDAYGHYLNHKQLSKLQNQTSDNANSMGSIDGSGMALKSASTTGTGASTSNSGITGGQAAQSSGGFAKMDSAALHEGTTGRLLSEFERKSGMKREDLMENIDQLAGEFERADISIEEQNDLIGHHYDQFAASMPNKDFGKGLVTAKSLVSFVGRMGILGHIVGERDSNKLTEKSPSAMALNASRSNAPASPAPPSPTGEQRMIASAREAPGAAAREKLELFVGVTEGSEHLFDSILGQADESASLFKRVSLRYRTLSLRLGLR